MFETYAESVDEVYEKFSSELVVKQDVHCQTETDNASPLPQNDIH